MRNDPAPLRDASGACRRGVAGDRGPGSALRLADLLVAVSLATPGLALWRLSILKRRMTIGDCWADPDVRGGSEGWQRMSGVLLGVICLALGAAYWRVATESADDAAQAFAPRAAALVVGVAGAGDPCRGMPRRWRRSKIARATCACRCDA
ncbi:hypothetical protein ACRAWD_27360 [Caulobacter segnis]